MITLAPNRGAMSVRTDGDDLAAAGAGACARCGARVPCACGGGARGGCGAGGAGGGGNTTPGRRFGSPQQSKGIRNVMSWAPGGSTTASVFAKDQDSRADSGDSDSEGSGRRRRSTGYGEDATVWHSDSSGGSARSVPSEESFNKSADYRGHLRDRRKSRSEENAAAAADGARDCRASRGSAEHGGARKRSRGVDDKISQGEDGGGSHSDQGTASNGSTSGAAAPARPKSPRSPRSHSSTRLKRVSGGGGGVGAEGNSSIDGDDAKGERATTATATNSDRDFSLRKEGNTDSRGGEGQEEGGGAKLARDIPPQAGHDTASNAAAPAERSTASADKGYTTSCRQGTGVVNDGPAVPQVASPGAPSVIGVASEVAGAPTPLGENITIPARRRSSAADAATAKLLVSDRPTDIPRTPRSPRLVGSSSETVKTAKRLSEALTFAASGSEERLLTSATVAAERAAVSRGPSPRRRSSAALAGALAVVEEAAVAANGTGGGC